MTKLRRHMAGDANGRDAALRRHRPRISGRNSPPHDPNPRRILRYQPVDSWKKDTGGF
jgi:hypothetical protein